MGEAARQWQGRRRREGVTGALQSRCEVGASFDVAFDDVIHTATFLRCHLMGLLAGCTLQGTPQLFSYWIVDSNIDAYIHSLLGVQLCLLRGASCWHFPKPTMAAGVLVAAV